MPPPQSLLFRAESVPHYINLTTQSKVLRVYRRLHRALSKLRDPLISPHLKQRAQHSFAAYKYVTERPRIEALLKQVSERELTWAEGAAVFRPKDLQKVLEVGFTSYKVKETPLKRVLNHPPTLCDHKSLVYKLNNVQMPTARTFAEHAKLKKRSKEGRSGSLTESFWTLVRLLRSNNIRSGANGRKLIFEPEDCSTSILTVFGSPVAKSRQANILRSLYSTFLRDAPRPVHPDVIEHLRKTLLSSAWPRAYRRRIQQCAQELWTVDAEGRMVCLRASEVLSLLPDNAN